MPGDTQPLPSRPCIRRDPEEKRNGRTAMTDEWAIMDAAGILYTGTEEEMRERWDNLDKIYMHNTILGDLLLIEIHGRIQ